MRTSPRNSPQAAARIVALALLAQGHPRRTEPGTEAESIVLSAAMDRWNPAPGGAQRNVALGA